MFGNKALSAAGKEGADAYLYFFFEDSDKSRNLGYALLGRFVANNPNWAPVYNEQAMVAQIQAITGWANVPDPEHLLLERVKHPVIYSPPRVLTICSTNWKTPLYPFTRMLPTDICSNILTCSVTRRRIFWKMRSKVLKHLPPDQSVNKNSVCAMMRFI